MIPDGWGEPSAIFNFCTYKYEDGGMVWMKGRDANWGDIEELRAATYPDIDIDYPTCIGGPSYRERKLSNNPGGCYGPS